MKTLKLLTTALLIFAALSVFLLYEVKEDCKICEKCVHCEKYELCKEERRLDRINRPPENADLTLKINCDYQDIYQVFQYDIVNSYSILGKLELNGSNTIDKIDFQIFEAGSCKRYYIEKVTYSKEYNSKPGKWLTFKINNDPSRPGNRGYHFEDDIPITLNSGHGKGFSVVIKSDNDSRIVTDKLWSDAIKVMSENKENEYSNNEIKNFPPIICQSTLYSTTQ